MERVAQAEEIMVVSQSSLREEEIMARMLFVLLMLALVNGCKVTTGFYIEKDWQTEELFKNPDLRTKAKIEMSRDFESWSELNPIHQRERV